MKDIMKILLWTLLSALALMLVSCGSKDKPNGPTNLDPGIYLPNGVVYKGETGASGLTPQLKFGVADADGNLLKRSWLIVDLVRGDGALPDSVQTGSDGYATLSYTFSDTLGYADVELMSRDYDTVQVRLRANLMKPGAEAVSGSDTTTIAGQGEYVIFDDDFGRLKAINGNPASVDIHPFLWVTYANYEAARGLVVPIEDVVQDEVAQDFEPVLGVIVNGVYGGTTAGSVGIGSGIAAFRAEFGVPDSMVLDIDPNFDPTHAVRCKYIEPEMIFWCDTMPDTNVFEMHFYWKPMPIVIGAPEDDRKVVPGAAAKTERPESSLRELQYQWRQATAR
jgi:hypothetical protein